MARTNVAFTQLPESLVEYIFAWTRLLEGQEKLSRDTLPLVCRGFNRIYRSSKLLWGTMMLTIDREASDEQVAGLLPSLRHRGPAVARLAVRLRSDKVTVPDLMASFSAELRLDLGYAGDAIDLPAGQISCLGRFSHLRGLGVYYVPRSPLEVNLSWLSELTEVQELRFLSAVLDFGEAGINPSISRLTSLSTLELGIFRTDARLNATLACLTRLQELHLSFMSRDQQELGAVCFTHLQQLSQLEVYHLRSGPNQKVGPQMWALSTMPKLQELSLRHCIDLDFRDLLDCSQLRRLSLCFMIPERFAALAGIRLPQGALPALTSLKWEPGIRRRSAGQEDIVMLGEEGIALKESFPEELCQLTQLQQLRARMPSIFDGTEFQVWVSLPAAFSQLRGLRRLQVSRLGLREVPAPIAGLSDLECLDLSRNFLTAGSFPPGPYLANLRYLNAHGNRLRQIPEALAIATKLEALDVSENLPYQFRAHQLALLPGLRRLYITKRLLYCSNDLKEFGSPAHMLEVLWGSNTLSNALRVHERFPSVTVIVDRYMQDEEWWDQEWATEHEGVRCEDEG